MKKTAGNSLLFHAITHSNIKDLISLLEDEEANVNARNINDVTPLHSAVNSQNLTVVELLLKYKADPNSKECFDIGECTPLHRAIELNNFEITKLLLDYGANPSLQCKKGFTALHYAARNGFIEITKLLINNGVDLYLRDKFGFNAAYWAKTNNHMDLLKLLPAPASITPEARFEYHDQLREFMKMNWKLPKKKKRRGKKKKK